MGAFSAILDDPILDLALFYIMLFFFSALHEYWHARVAVNCGDISVKNRVTWNPIAHIGFIESILFPCVILYLSDYTFLFCSAKTAPISPYSYQKQGKDTASVAFAGSFANIFSIAVIFVLLICSRLVISPEEMSESEYLVYFVQNWVLINAFLIFFHLLPLPPLDGFKIIQGFLPPWRTFFLVVDFVGSILLLVILWTYPEVWQFVMNCMTKVWHLFWECYA